MTKNEIFELYKLVQQKDREAEKKLIAEHKKAYPRHSFHKGIGPHPKTDPYYRNTLHTMYLHLYK